MPEPISKSMLLAAEGTHDAEFFDALLQEIGLSEEVEVRNYGGIRGLPAFLSSLSKDPLVTAGHLVALGVTRDAETIPVGETGPVEFASLSAADRAFQSVRGALKRASFPFPDSAGGIEFGDPGKPRVGVFILPDNNRDGSMETLCMSYVRERPEMDCIREFLDCARRTANLTPSNVHKAEVQAWLSVQKDADLHLGRAAEKGYWDFDHPTFADIRGFVQRLFAC